MKYWLSIIEKLDDQISGAIQLLLLSVSLYIIILANDAWLWKLPILFFGLVIWFFFRHKTKHPIIWIVFSLILVLDLFSSYFWVANHHFMLLFVVLSVLSYKYHENADILSKNIQLVLFIVVVASVIQKLTSTDFLKGNFYYYAINTGAFFKKFINLFPESLDAIKSNSEKISNLNNTDPNLNQKAVFKDAIPYLTLVSVFFAWFTIAIEVLVAFFMIWKPRKSVSHILLLIMILGVLFVRLETGFMTLLAISGLFLCRNPKLKLVYVLIILGCITLIMTKVGYH